MKRKKKKKEARTCTATAARLFPANWISRSVKPRQQKGTQDIFQKPSGGCRSPNMLLSGQTFTVEPNRVLFSSTQAQRSPRAVQDPGLSSSENKRPLMAQTEVCPSRLEEQRTPPLASVREDVPSSDPSVSHIRPEFHLKGSLSERLWIRLSFSFRMGDQKL